MYNVNPMNYSVSYDEEHKFAILQAICDLDDKIVKELFPKDKEYPNEGRDLYTGFLWLTSNIITLLMESDDVLTMTEQIEGMIKESPYAEVILNEYINMEELMDEAEIRSNFSAAFKKVKKGSELAPRIRYALGEADLRTLALLHKADKHREKIEYLLEACNFHYENAKFYKGEYEEFLTLDSAKEVE